MKQLSFFSGDGDRDTALSTVYWKISIDGASRGNPGAAGVGIAIAKNDSVVQKAGYYVGIKTNNQAEYLALIFGLLLIKDRVGSNDMVMIVSDSQLLVRQVKGLYRVKNHLLLPLYQLVKQLLVDMRYDIAHVMRENNVEADRWANIGVDKRIAPLQNHITFLRTHEIFL